MTRVPLNQCNGLDMDAAVRMFRYHAGNTSVTYEDAKNVINMCDKNPLVIKVNMINFASSDLQKLCLVHFKLHAGLYFKA